MKNTILLSFVFASAAAFASSSDGVFYTDDFSDTTLSSVWTEVTEEAQTLNDDSVSIVGNTLCDPDDNSDLTLRVVELDFVAEGAAEDPSVIMDETQIAVVTGITNENHTVNLWICDASGWTDTGVTVAEGSTNSLSCVFTYGDPSTCDVIITNTAGTVLLSGTYTNRLTAAVAQLEVDGTTEIDNVYLADLLKYFSTAEVTDDTATSTDLTGIVVAYTNLVAWGVDAIAVTAGQANMLVAGVETVEKAELFALKDFLTTDEGRKQVTIPCEHENGQKYRAVFFTPEDPTTYLATAEADAGDIASDGTRTITFTMPEESNFSTSKTILFTIQAYAPGS